MTEDGDLLRYYMNEIASLRSGAVEFARNYPKVARRLELSRGESSDPHVERLMESFAYLTGRLQQQLDLEFPEVCMSLLEILYPELARPVPPMSVVQFQGDMRQGKLTGGHRIPRNTNLFAQTPEGVVCRFRTSYDVDLWPIEVADCRFLGQQDLPDIRECARAAAGLRVTLRAVGNTFEELSARSLRFHISGERSQTSALYDLLFGDLQSILLIDEQRVPLTLDANALKPVGFARDEDVLGGASWTHPGYRLLQEYLHFPVKFHFFDLSGLDRNRAQSELEVLFLFRRPATSRILCDKFTLLPGCTPIANLFPRTTEPVRIDRKHVEYALIPDMRREHTTEIHSILSVTASVDPTKPSLEVLPYFSFRHNPPLNSPVYWHARRVPTGRQDLPGTQMRIAFLDMDYSPADPPAQILYAHTLCTNRELALQIASSTKLTSRGRSNT